jgi:hypothetical protein
VLATREMGTPLVFKEKFGIAWSRGDVTITKSGRINFDGEICCEQEVMLEEDRVVDYAMIVQLSREEAAEFGLVSALGVIEGKKLS